MGAVIDSYNCCLLYCTLMLLCMFISLLFIYSNQANPFFVRCIKSNADKTPGHFDDMLVLVQLRYTGMLDTVRIRQSGYSVRLSFDEFIQHYRILLPKGLISSQSDIRDFLARMNLNRDNYQMGKSKIFMRESEKLALDNLLHREILHRIVTLQRWVRTWITRRRFVLMRQAAICLQAHARRWLAQQQLAKLKDFVVCERAATTIQRTWKAFKERSAFLKLRAATINFQAHARGYLSRKEFQRRRSQQRAQKAAAEAAAAAAAAVSISTPSSRSNSLATPPTSPTRKVLPSFSVPSTSNSALVASVATSSTSSFPLPPAPTAAVSPAVVNSTTQAMTVSSVLSAPVVSSQPQPVTSVKATPSSQSIPPGPMTSSRTAPRRPSTNSTGSISSTGSRHQTPPKAMAPTPPTCVVRTAPPTPAIISSPSVIASPPVPPNRRKSTPTSKPSAGQNGLSSWNVTRTTEFTDPKDVLIADVSELHYLETFLDKKINLMDNGCNRNAKESMVDVIFMSALKEFKTNLISTYSVASHEPHQMHISYKNLIDHFEQVMMHVCQREHTYKSFPVIMGVNAFRGFLDEFRNLATKYNLVEKTKKLSGVPKRRRPKSKKARGEDIIESCGHIFKSTQANIPTMCEVCSSLLWLMEKIWVCQQCKLTCHKKCAVKITATCGLSSSSNKSTRQGCFGVPLDRLVDEERRVPQVVEDLVTKIEMKGLYTEGLYRKSGTTSKINEVKNKLDAAEAIDLDSYSINVLTGVLKCFLREMPEPLMTFELYDDFLWASTTTDEQERFQAIYSHILKLPPAHFELLERLSFHLARVASLEHANRMNANSLAIVLAPCILRTDRQQQMQDRLNDIDKQTK